MTTVTDNKKNNSQVMDVSDSIGEFIEYWGFKKIHGRIWALIFLAKEPVNAKYLINNLGVSKALVSISIKDLLEYDVIMTSQKKMSTVHYVSNPNLSEVITNVILGREAKILLKIKNSCELLEQKTNLDSGSVQVSKERLQKLKKMVSMANMALKTFTTIKQFSFRDFKKSLTID